MLAGCASPTGPSQSTPPVTPTAEPPKISCPAAQTAQSLDGGSAIVTFTPTVVNGQPPMTTTCTPAAGSAFTVGQRTVSCTTTDALQRTDTCSFSVTVTSPPRLASTTFLAFGDSITAGEDGQSSTASSISAMSARVHPFVLFPASARYPQELQAELAARYKTQQPTVDNQGEPGETASASATLTRFVSLTSTHRYSAVLIMEGTNDLYDRDDHIFPAAYSGLRAMIHDAKGRGMRPYLATIPPMDPTKCSPICRGLAWSLVANFNDGVRSLAVSEGVTLVDVYQGFGSNFALLGPDGMHPAAEGYQKIADLFYQAISSTLEASSTGVATASRRTAAR